MAFLACAILALGGFASAQTPTASSPLIINQGPTSRCYSWYAELSDAGGYPSEAEWQCPYLDHVGRFTLGTNGWNYTYYEQTPGFNGSVNGAQGSPLSVALHNDARSVSCRNRELAFTYDFPGSALFSDVSTLDLAKWDSVIIEFDVNVITATSDKSGCTCLLDTGKQACPDWWKTQFTTDILYWWGSEQHDTGDYNVISVRHLDPQNYGFWTWTNAQPGQDHYGHRIQYTDHQASPGQKSHVKLDIKHLIHKYSSQLCQGGGIQGPIHLNSVQFVLINTGSETKLEFSNVKANAFNYAPGQFTPTEVVPGCTPTNCPTQPSNTAYVCGTDPAQPPPGSVTSPTPTPCATPQTMFGQCGGSGWTGATCCPAGASCQTQNEYYAQCLTTSGGGGGASPTTMTTTTTGSPSGPCGAQQTMYGQCGGSGYYGLSCCPAGSTCQVQNEYYSQCLP